MSRLLFVSASAVAGGASAQSAASTVFQTGQNGQVGVTQAGDNTSLAGTGNVATVTQGL